MASKPVVYVPVKLDAFVLNKFSSKGYPDNASVAPISQPNYTFLRLDAGLIQNDVLPYHDISHASPASINPRMTDLGTGSPKTKRQGVYLHWMLPRCYRAGSAAKTDAVPMFKTAPDRWVVIRRLHPGPETANVIRDGQMKEITAWIVESNRLRNVQDFDKSVDVELDCAPYLRGDLTSPEGQAEVYIGKKTLLTKPDSWKEAAPDSNNFVPLGALNTANPLFADFTPHCSNVFSIIDNFEYNSGSGKKYLEKATASYTVLGWHGEEAQDFLTNSGAVTMSDLLAKNFLTMPAAKSDDFLNKPSSGRVLCHGTMYTVNYSAADADYVQPSAAAAKKFANPSSHPVTVGTTPLDSVLSYVRAYNDSSKQNGGRDAHLDETQADILHLETLLLKQEDDIDSQQEAHDMLSANNFEPCLDSGSFWSFSAALPPKGSPATANSRTQKLFQPSIAQKQDLQNLNNLQAVIDATKRELKDEQWNLFALWWKYVSDKSWQAKKPTSLVNDQILAVKGLKDRVDSLAMVLPSLLKPFAAPGAPGNDPKKATYIVEQNSRKRFYTQRDPSILVPGLANPWPADWLLPLPTRLSSQVKIPDLPSQLPSGWGTLKDMIDSTVSPCFSGASQPLKDPAIALIREFFNLRPDNVPEARSLVRGKPEIASQPHYHDGRDAWNNTQAWFPLFLEWEIRYCHLPWSLWDFNQTATRFRPNEAPRVRYGIRPDQVVADLSKNQAGAIKDEREIDGRVLILPQPGFSLRVSIEQLLSSVSEDELPDTLKPALDPDTGEVVLDPTVEFLNDVAQIQILSAPLTGFMDHLVTRLLGTHIKPTVRDPLAPGAVLPLDAAMKGEVGFTSDVIKLLGDSLDKTPFSDYVPFESGISPLKPVTHGQFRFTKLNVIDKFGQAISAIDPRIARNIPPLYPNLSEYFHPQMLGGDTKRNNVVIEDPAGCQFAQYPPTINQDARLNGSFMLYDQGQKIWRPAGDWDDPVWGFVVLNYAENGVQIFLPDGQFYREVRLGGPNKATQSIEWQPFEPPSDKQARDTDPKVYRSKGYAQLDALMAQLSKPEYLRSFFAMVNKALAALPQTPNQYAQYLSAIIGRPLALTNIGFSLELAGPSFQNQSTLSNTPPDIPLTSYNFTVKVGDQDRAYDGLVCLFKQKGDGRAVPGQELDLSTMITYFPAGKDRSTRRLDRSQYFDLSPYHISAQNYKLDQRDPLAAGGEVNRVMLDHYSKITRLGALIDPFAKVHAYSGILPITTLQLPSWTLQSAMQRMTAFFRMGPLIVTTPDLQRRYDENRNLSTESNSLEIMAAAQPQPAATPAGEAQLSEAFSGIPLPALASADWNWLQPYAVASPKPSEASGQPVVGDKSKTQHWNPFTIASLDNKPRFEPGPYTAIEGFLQLTKPIADGKDVAL